MPATEPGAPLTPAAATTTILRLTVNNHPGVMLQICGLFARRAFNLEGIFCSAIGQGATSRIWLKVADNDKLEQVVKQLAKLEDVCTVEQPTDVGPHIETMEAMMARIG